MKQYALLTVLATALAFGANPAVAGPVCDASGNTALTLCNNPLTTGCHQCDVSDAEGPDETLLTEDDAQCDTDRCVWDCVVNTPGKAKGGKMSMVRAYAPCVEGASQVAPDLTTSSGLDACIGGYADNGLTGLNLFGLGPIPRAAVDEAKNPTTYVFDEKKGKCDFAVSAKLLGSCADVPNTAFGANDTTDPCLDLTVSVKCSGIVDGETGELAENPGPMMGGWALETVSRATTMDSLGGAATFLDFPLTFNTITDNIGGDGDGMVGGKLNFKGSSNDHPLLGVLLKGAGLSHCTAIELVSATLLAPGGQPFASLGSAVRPKDKADLLFLAN